ncbi:MAG TPA: hypothetical protein VEB18_04365 [Candidatus Paceibacterota bacterium]|nr:hypothetical protein [Candidatus Paceibacterota bacterium]
MGFLAFSAGPVAPPETAASVIAAEVATTTLAVAEAPTLIRPTEEEVYTVKLTSYNAVPEQTDHNPTVTASGVRTNPEIIAARSIDLAAALPYGTVIELSRDASDTASCGYGAVEHLIGYRVVADSMHSRKRAQIDVLLNEADTVTVSGKEVNPSIALGVCSGVKIRVLGKLDIADLPETQEELRKLVEGNALALR